MKVYVEYLKEDALEQILEELTNTNDMVNAINNGDKINLEMLFLQNFLK